MTSDIGEALHWICMEVIKLSDVVVRKVAGGNKKKKNVKSVYVGWACGEDIVWGWGDPNIITLLILQPPHKFSPKAHPAHIVFSFYFLFPPNNNVW